MNLKEIKKAKGAPEFGEYLRKKSDSVKIYDDEKQDEKQDKKQQNVEFEAIRQLKKYQKMWNTLENKVRDEYSTTPNIHRRQFLSEMLEEILEVKEKIGG